MQRQIKLRVWDNELNRFLLPTQEGYYDVDLVYANDEWYIHGVYKLPDRHILEQFTEMTDGNGKEVWEGDIVCEKRTDPFDCGESHIGMIHFCAGSFFIDGDGPLYDHTYSHSPNVLEDYTVIGNIHENKDLLTK